MNNQIASQLEREIAPKISFNQGKTEIDRGSASGAGVEGSILYEQAIGVNPQPWKSYGNIFSGAPVSCHFSSIQQTCHGERVNTGAYSNDPSRGRGAVG